MDKYKKRLLKSIEKEQKILNERRAVILKALNNVEKCIEKKREQFLKHSNVLKIEEEIDHLEKVKILTFLRKVLTSLSQPYTWFSQKLVKLRAEHTEAQLEMDAKMRPQLAEKQELQEKLRELDDQMSRNQNRQENPDLRLDVLRKSASVSHLEQLQAHQQIDIRPSCPLPPPYTP